MKSNEGWIEPEIQMPAPNTVVQVRGVDSEGEWTAHALWVPYKGKPVSYKAGRWNYTDGVRLGGWAEVGAWRAKS